MISPDYIAQFFALKCLVLRRYTLWFFLLIQSSLLSACATGPVTSPAQLEAYPHAVTVPYRISDAGHVIIDVAVNGHAARPFIIDSGANVSAVYDDFADDLDLSTSGKFISVNGLVASALRPLTTGVELQIGGKSFQRERVVILEKQSNSNEATGLIGVDVLAGYAVLFNKENLTATLIPSADIKAQRFSGWRRIPLKNRVGSFPDKGLYFATVFLKGRPAPVLIDTGSELNFVNWELASEDEDLKELRRSLRKQVKLEGATDVTTLSLRGRFYDVRLGKKDWPEVDVTILDFDKLDGIAPVDRPMMLAGVNMFSASTFLFDFGGNAIYIQKGELE